MRYSTSIQEGMSQSRQIMKGRATSICRVPSSQVPSPDLEDWERNIIAGKTSRCLKDLSLFAHVHIWS